MKSFNLLSIFSFLILTLIVNQILAGQFCYLEIKNDTNHTLKLTNIKQYQMNYWNFRNEIINKGETGVAEIEPSSWIFYNLDLTGADAYYNLTDTDDYLDIRFRSLGAKTYELEIFSKKDRAIYNYPAKVLLQRCTFKVSFNYYQGRLGLSKDKSINTII